MAGPPQSRVPDVRVSTRYFALWWLAMLLLHSIAVIFFGFCAVFYWQLEGTYLDTCLQFYEIGMETSAYSTIAALQGSVVIPHVFLILKMVCASVYHRSFAFSFASRSRRRKSLKQRRLKSKNQHESRLGSTSPTPSGNQVAPFGTQLRVDIQIAFRWPTWMAQAYHFLCDREGFFGVEGRYFHMILFVRELIETSLQTVQAYRMSFYLARVWLNRFYVTLLVLNCWLTPLIHFAYKKNEAKKRLFSLLCDCALDLAASVLIPSMILATYFGSYDQNIKGFDALWWYDDVWYVHVMHDFQILLVTSWRDLGTRLVFALGMIVAMGDIKELVIEVCATNQVNPLTAIGASGGGSAVARTEPSQYTGAGPPGEAVQAAVTASRKVKMASAPAGESLFATMQQHLRTASAKLARSKSGHYLAMVAHGLMFLWGVAIVGFHLHAGSKAQLSQCLLQVRPWGKPNPACSLVLLNCHSSGINGSRNEIYTQWEILDPKMVVCVLIRHCEALEMPPILQTFSQMEWMKVYNTTIADWGEEAAITATNHPAMLWLFFVRVNFPNGELPIGLLSPEFPPAINDIEFSVTNLHTLPGDLDTKWPQHVQLYLEFSMFTVVPEVLFRMNPMYISFDGNPIQEIPSWIFEMDSLIYIHFGNTSVKALPENVISPSNSGWFYYFYGTQISYFPAWVDGIVTAGYTHGVQPIFASGTPYCSEWVGVVNGSLSEFSVDPLDSSSASVLMNASRANHKLLYQSVSCYASNAVTMFPLEFEDEMSALYGRS